MSPVLRGEALPLRAQELDGLRDNLPRGYGESVVPAGGGPILAIRVPYREPDFLRDLEAAVDVLPYRDLAGFRIVLLIGDRDHMGVSVEMLRALMDGKRQAEADWVGTLRQRLDPWGFVVARMPADPRRHLRAVFRVEVESVADLNDPHFDRLGALLPAMKAASPGQTRPELVHLVSHTDHVVIDGAKFFTELERRRRRQVDGDMSRHRRELEIQHARAVAELSRILTAPPTATAAPIAPPAPVVASRPTAASIAPAAALPRYPVMPRVAPTDAVAAVSRPVATPVDARFADVDRHPAAFALLRSALSGAGYRTKEKLVVRDLPFALAGARDQGYPTKVLVAFTDRLDGTFARRLIDTGRSVGSELIVAVADAVLPEAEKAVLATNVKIVAPADVPALRFG